MEIQSTFAEADRLAKNYYSVKKTGTFQYTVFAEDVALDVFFGIGAEGQAHRAVGRLQGAYMLGYVARDMKEEMKDGA